MKVQDFLCPLVPLRLLGVLSGPLLLGFQGCPSAQGSRGSQEAQEGLWFRDSPSSPSFPFHLVAPRILHFLDILLDQAVPLRLHDLAFQVVLVPQEILVYPGLESLGLLLALFRLFCLVVPSAHLSLEDPGLPWDPANTFLVILFLQVVQAALDLLVVHQAPLFLELQGHLEVQGVRFLHVPQNCLFLPENLAFLVLQAWLELVLPWLLGGLAFQVSLAFPFLQDTLVNPLSLENLDLL